MVLDLTSFRGQIRHPKTLQLARIVMNRIYMMSDRDVDSAFFTSLAGTPAPVIEATAIRTSRGISLMYWEDHNVLLCMRGVPSIAPGSLVRLTPVDETTEEGARRLASAHRIKQRWLIDDIKATVIYPNTVNSSHPVAKMMAQVAILNSVFFTCTIVGRDGADHILTDTI